MQVLKKISVATAVSIPRSEFKSMKVQTPVLRVFGVVRDCIEGNHAQYGLFYKFKGDFRAVDLITGTESVSSVAYFPAPIDEMVAEQIRAITETGDRRAAVEIAIDISVLPDEHSSVGYQYVVENLQDMQVSDPMAALMARISVPKIEHQAQLTEAIKGGKSKAKANHE